MGGRLCPSSFTPSLKSLVSMHIKCHCDWLALWNGGMCFPLKIKHLLCIDEKGGCSLTDYFPWSAVVIVSFDWSLTICQTLEETSCSWLSCSRHRGTADFWRAAAKISTAPTTDTWLCPVKSLLLSVILLFTINLISCTLHSFVLLIRFSKLTWASFHSASMCQNYRCVGKTGSTRQTIWRHNNIFEWPLEVLQPKPHGAYKNDLSA